MRVAVLDDWEAAAGQLLPWEELPEGVSVTAITNRSLGEDHVAARLEPFDAVFAMRERTPFPRSLLERLPRLRLLVTSGAGNPSIDMDAARDLGIVVCGAPGGSASEGVAELTMALLLGLARDLPAMDRSVRSGRWGGRLGKGLHGRRLGLVGLGKIGGLVAVRAKAFGMDVVAWSENLTVARADELGVRPVDRDELFAESDAVSLHLRLSERTRGLVGRELLATMRPTSYLINTSRSGLVDADALVNALASGRLAGAALDVFDAEPLPLDDPLLRLENVTLLVPHIGYVTDTTMGPWFVSYVEVLRAFVAGDPINVINEGVTPRS